MKIPVLRIAVAVIVAVVFAFSPFDATAGETVGPPAPLTVAFIGDQGSTDGALAVLRLIRDEGADMVIHLGDLDYRNDPESWDRTVTSVLGEDFPVFVTVGNHDVKRWRGPNGYQARLRERLDRVREARCSGDLGVRAACTYRGLFFIQSGIGTMPRIPDFADHISFIRNELGRTDAAWRICSWHKNQGAMQVGGKGDEVGWKAYEACRKGGAIIVTAHEHSYSRTHLMESFRTGSVASTSRTLEIGKGMSFAVVSGLAGRDVRPQKRGGDWWASIHTLDQDANFGALFCTFFANGQPDHADCYFKDIDGRVPDRFKLISRLGQHR